MLIYLLNIRLIIELNELKVERDFIMIKIEDWIVALAGLVGIIITYLITKQIIRKYISNEKTKGVISTIINWMTLFVVIVYVVNYFSYSEWLFDPFYKSKNTQISLFTVFIAIFLIILAIRISVFLKKFILPGIYDKYNLDMGIRFTFDSIFQYLIIIIAVFISLSNMGFNLSSITVLASVVGVGIGFGMQNIASNFISGIIILFERPIKVGDRVIVDDIIGDVSEIRMRATIVQTLDNERIIIPNSFFLEEKIINRSHSDTRLRLNIPIGVSYDSDVELVKKLLEDSVNDIKVKWDTIMDKPECMIHFVGFGDSSLDFKLFVWIDNPIYEFKIKSDLNFMILSKFRKNNIEIPFPQRDVHIIN
jgi:small-conductance mechanosensitive channel